MNQLLQTKTRRIILSVLIALTALFGLLLFTVKQGGAGFFGIVFSAGQSGRLQPVVLTVAIMTLLCVPVYVLFALNGILSLFVRKKDYVCTLYVGAAIFFALLIVGAGQRVYTGAQALLCVLNILLCVLGLVYHYLCVRNHMTDFEDNISGPALSQQEKMRKLLLTITSVISCAAPLSMLFSPFISYMNNTHDPIIPIKSLTGAATSLRFFVFLITLVAVAVSFILLVRMLGRSSGEPGCLVPACRALVYYNIVVSFLYFLVGYIYVYFVDKNHDDMVASGYVPFLMSIFCALLFVCVLGSCYPKMTVKENTPVSEKVFRVVMLVSTVLFTVCTSLTLFMNIISAEYDTSFGKKKVVINGLKLLKNYGEMSKSYRTIAFIIMIVLVLSGLLLLAVLMSYIGKSKLFNRLAIVAVTVNVLGTTVVGVCGKYFEIVQAINVDVIAEIFGDLTWITDLTDMGFKVKSDAYIPMLVSIALLAVLLIIAPVTRLEKRSLASAGMTADDAQEPILTDVNEPEITHTEEADFDACPAFTELDSRVPAFGQDLVDRRASSFDGAMLPDIVRFIVRYAADCRLHLSYREEEIADFIAGLGATRLTILQGMSGTGKTSLPKIVTEALMGNCDIIEVESSWRDKNELLGYYNEFSRTYTPRKFTQALYKAKLNPDIPTFIVLDEMNLSRIEYYFSDFLSLMENEEDKREIKLLNVKLYHVSDHEKTAYRGLDEGHTMHIPQNVWFIGTANRDESTFAISDKVYDRAHTMNFRHRAAPVSGSGEVQAPRFVSYTVLSRLLEAARSSVSLDVEQDETVRLVERLLSPFNVSFGNRVARQIETYVKTYCCCFRDSDARRQEALENVLLSEVVSKLENKTVENKTALAAEFDKLGLHRCAAFVRSLNEEYL